MPLLPTRTPPAPKPVETPTVAKLEPYWKSECGRAVIYKGDCREVMRQLEAESVSSVVSDPPYGLEFMGKQWDAPWKNNGSVDAAASVTYGTSDSVGFQVWFQSCAVEILRVAKPGAYLLAFGGTRMFHRLVCGVEDAGFEIRDTVMWVYGSGFPKSHDVSKAIDKAYGVEREVVGQRTDGKRSNSGSGCYQMNDGVDTSMQQVFNATAPATADAIKWQGWGSALKPALEPIVMARKPLIGTVAQNVLEYGTGGINIDECRVGVDGGCKHEEGTGGYDAGTVNALGGHLNSARRTARAGLGRWPANLIHDGSAEAIAGFPETGPSSGADRERIPTTSSGNALNLNKEGAVFANGVGYDDNGGSAARYFYTPKASGTDRDNNSHPTVKPVDLMCYLVRLVTAKDHVVLDPFMGSGSTGVATIEEGCRFIGIEQDEKYCDIAIGRIKRKLIEKGYAKDAPPPVVKKLGKK